LNAEADSVVVVTGSIDPIAIDIAASGNFVEGMLSYKERSRRICITVYANLRSFESSVETVSNKQKF
jgi:hypothetical protein